MNPSQRRKSVRFDTDDTITVIDTETADTETEVEFDEPPPPLPSPSNSNSTTSSSTGPHTPPQDSFGGLFDYGEACDGQNDSDGPWLHPSISMNGSFFWDMAHAVPDELEELKNTLADPVCADKLSRTLYGELALVIGGLYHWKIRVLPEDEQVCTVKDVLVRIYKDMSKFVAKEEVDRHDKPTRKRIFQAREARCREMGLDVTQEPLRRVDCLCGARRFLGIAYDSTLDDFKVHVGLLPPAL